VDLSYEIEKIGDARAHQDIHEGYALDLDYESTFRLLQREAIFLTLYNYFEHFLSELCEWISDEVRSRVRLGDINGRGITRALLFLDLIPELKFDRIPDVHHHPWFSERYLHPATAASAGTPAWRSVDAANVSGRLVQRKHSNFDSRAPDRARCASAGPCLGESIKPDRTPPTIDASSLLFPTTRCTI
jgi:hypothetical protein